MEEESPVWANWRPTGRQFLLAVSISNRERSTRISGSGSRQSTTDRRPDASEKYSQNRISADNLANLHKFFIWSSQHIHNNWIYLSHQQPQGHQHTIEPGCDQNRKIDPIQHKRRFKMKNKGWIIVTILSIAVLSFAVASPALAADPARGGGNGSRGGGGYGHGGASGTGLGTPVEQNINLDGVLEELYQASMAETLGIDLDELIARMDAGETFSDIAVSLGYDQTEVQDLLDAARADALAQAVLDGTITQEQADWIASRGSHMDANGLSDGTCDGDCTSDGSSLKYTQRQAQGKGYGK
jgi:hypothetical protein